MSKRMFIGCGAHPRNTIGRVRTYGTLDLRQHALLARLHQFELAQAEGIAAESC